MADVVHQTIPRYGNRSESVRRDDDVTILGAVLRRTSWGALLAGTVVAISVQMILTVLGIAIGVTSSELVNGVDRTGDGMATTAGLWWLVSGTLSLFIGGCVVGRFTGMTRSPDVLLHGLTMWAITALFGFMVVTAGAGALYGTAMNATYVGTQPEFGTQEVDRVNGRRAINARADSFESNVSLANNRGLTAEQAQRYVQAASWWTLLGLVLGIVAALGGSWLTAPQRIAVLPASEKIPV